MLGSRNQSASIKQSSKRPDSKASQKSGLLGRLSDGVEGSSSGSSINSSGSVREGNYLHQKLVKNQLQYLGSDGSVFTIAQPRRNSPKGAQQAHRSNYLNRIEVMRNSSSPNSSSTINLEQAWSRKKELTVNSDQRQQQHRRLQYQVHQQLQRIYGNTERQRDQNQTSETNHHYMVDEQLKQHNNIGNDHHQHRQQTPQHQQNQNQQQQHRHQIADRMQQRNLSSANINFASQQQFRENLMKNQPLMMMNIQTDQTYDSLSPACVSKHQMNEGFYAVDSNNNHPRQNPISAIPEECNGDDEDEVELLIPRTVVTNRAVLDQKNQLEDLHYATATAAALLSATANAAAAFAANAEKQFDKKEVANELRGCSSTVEQQNLINTIYSDAYQEVRKQQRCHPEPHPAALAGYKKQQHHLHQHNHRNSIYPDSLDQSNCMGVSNERQRIQTGPATSTSSAIYSPLIRGNVANQSQIYSILPSNYQQYQAPNFNRPMPPQPPLRRLLGRPPPVVMNNINPYNHQRQNHRHDLINQQQQLFQQHLQLQQQQLQQRQQQQQNIQQHPTSNAPAVAIPLPLTAPVSTLAIVHQGKNTSIKADLLGRMLVNNMIAAQQVATKSNDSTHYATSSAQIVDRSRAMVEQGNNLASRHILSPGRDKIYRTPGHVFSINPAVAPSESSGQSNVPLVLDRELKPIGFIERICRIDLAVFWWSLIIVSFLFIGIMMTISRYIF